jgi:hypothetical protein
MTIFCCLWYTESKSKLCYDRRSVGQCVLVSSTHLGLTTRFSLLSDSCRFVDVGRSLWRENGSADYNCCWSSPAQSFLGPSPAGLVTIFYCLRFETSLFVIQFLCYSVFLYLFVATGTYCRIVAQQWTSASVLCCCNVCFASRWLAVDFRSGSTIPVFRRHVTIWKQILRDSFLRMWIILNMFRTRSSTEGM